MTTEAGNVFGRGLLAAAFLVFSVWIVAAANDAFAADEGEAAPAADGAAASIDAASLWSKNCKACHGDDGKGDTKAGKMKHVENLTDAEVRAKFDRARMLKSVTDGINDEAGKSLMKGYGDKLSADEIAALVDYVIALPH